MYRIKPEYDSNPHRALKEKSPQSLFGLIFIVYIPLLFVMLIARGLMIRAGHIYFDLPAFDSQAVALVKYFSRLLTFS